MQQIAVFRDTSKSGDGDELARARMPSLLASKPVTLLLVHLLLVQGWLRAPRIARAPLISGSTAARSRSQAVYASARPDAAVYATLGVAPGSADLDAIRSSFRKRAKDLHPDVNSAPDAAEDFRQLVRP